MQTLTIAAQNSVDAQDIGVATSSATFFRQIGGTLGVAVFLSILFNTVTTTIADAFKSSAVIEGFKSVQTDLQNGKALAGDATANQNFLQSLQGGDMASLGDSIKSDSSFIGLIDPRLAAPFKIGFANASLAVFGTAAIVLLVAFVMSWFMKNVALREKSAMAEKADAAAAAAH
jgi:hypothetical protein